MQKIKYLYFLSIFLILSSDFIYAQDVIKSASEYDYPPYSIVTETGDADGFSVELLRASLKAVGLDVDFYVSPWAEIKQDLAEGKIQVLPLVGRTPERESIYDFSVPYLTNYGGIFVRTDETNISTLKDLRDKEILVMEGDNAEEFILRENVSKQITTTESFEDAFKMLSEGKHDAVVAQQIVGKQLIDKLGITNVINISRIDEYKQDWTFAVKEGDKKLLARLNNGLSIIIINGTFDIIYDKWFGISGIDKETLLEKRDKFSYAKDAIKQKAEDVARQVEIYLSAYPDKTLKDLQNDPEFQKIAIQTVGKTGYTAISDYDNLVALFHPIKNLIGVELDTLSADYPVMWELIKQAKGGNDVSGKYEFLDLNGVVKDKYLYIKIVKNKTADGVGMWVAATTYLDEYKIIDPKEEEKESISIISMVWVLGILIFVVLFLSLLNKLNIIKFEKNTIMLFFAISLLLIIGLFIFNAYNITNNLKKSAIENFYDTLRATASSKYINIEQHITHMRSSFKVLSSRKTISNEDLMKIVELGEDFYEIFIISSNGKITQSSDISHIGFSRLTDLYFKNSREGIYIKPLYLSETIREVSFTISTPYNTGVLVARLNLNHIHEIISKHEGLGESGESLLAYRNENGDAVFFTERRFTTVAEARDTIAKGDINVPITQALLGNEQEFSNYVDYRDVPVFAVTKYIDEIDAGLVVKIDKKEALKSVSVNIHQIWYSTTLIIFAIIIIGIIFYFLLTFSLRREVKSKTSELEKASKILSEKVFLLQNSERKLIESEEKVRNIFDNSTIVHYSHDVDQVSTYVSPQIKDILGYTPEELMVNWKNLASDNPINEIALNSTRKAIETGERQPAYELEILDKNGEKLYVEVYEAPVVKNGNTVSIVGSFTDITARKRALEEKALLEIQYRQAQKMESIGTLAGGIAHDFNNILGAIIGYTEMARDDSPKGSSVANDLDKVLEASDRAASLVKQILAFSRQDEINNLPIQPATIAKKTIEMVRSTLPTTIEITQDIDLETGLIFADSTQIHQILMNLCTNAFHAMEETGGLLSISLKETTVNNEDLIHEPDTKPGTFIQLSVCDSGPGMTQKVKDQIFDPYFTTKETGKGTGMGLSIVHGIVKSYGGFIILNSEPGEGTAFHVFLPVVEKEVLPDLVSDEQIPVGMERILFIDDEDILADMGQDMLDRLGYHVTVRKNSLEAIETFQNQPDQFDLVITDQTMPGMTGVDLARRMLQIRPDIPIILCTGYSSIVSEEKAKSFGIREFALKPLTKKNIATLIRKVLDDNQT